MVFHDMLSVQTRERAQMVDITDEIRHCVAHSGITSGIVTVCTLHTTSGLTINENADPDVCTDILAKLARLVPYNDGYRHGEGNSDSHVKASLLGSSVQVPLQERHLVLGTWQGIYFCEFDGPRNRRVTVTVIGE